MYKMKYQPYKSVYSSKTHEPKNKAKWFDYDPYPKEKIQPKPYDASPLDANALLQKAPIVIEKPTPIPTTQASIGNLIFKYLLQIIHPIFTEIKLSISHTIGNLLSKIKQK